MNYFLCLTIVLISLLPTSPLLASEIRCLGGDGGTPFANITKDIKLKQTIIPSKDWVKDFVYQEQTEQLIYRNLNNQLRSFNIVTGRDRFLNYADKTISRLIDDQSSRILSSSATYFLNTSSENPNWHYFAGPSEVKQHLFWHQKTIYSLQTIESNKGKYDFVFLKYSERDHQQLYCHQSKNIGKIKGLAPENTFPFLYFYATKNGLLENKVIVYRMNVDAIGYGSTCPMEQITEYPESKLGPIKAFYSFHNKNFDAFAFHLDHPEKTLFWDKPGECAFYNFKGKTPVFISSKQPIFASWENGKGLTLHNLQEQTEVTFFKAIKINNFTTENIWMSDNGQKFFTSVERDQTQAGRLLVETVLPSWR